MRPPSLLIYGANGYTGELTARLAAEQGMQPIVAGRNEAQVAAEAARYGLPYRVDALDDPAGLDTLLQDVPVVLHRAGPFVYTATPMVNAGLLNRVR